MQHVSFNSGIYIYIYIYTHGEREREREREREIINTIPHQHSVVL